MNDETLSEIAAQVQQQNDVLLQLETTLRTLGDVELSVPKAFLEELDELAAARPAHHLAMPVFGIRV